MYFCFFNLLILVFGEFRLNNKNNLYLKKSSTGRLEKLGSQRQWIPICENDFSKWLADSICVQMGFKRHSWFGSIAKLKLGNLGCHLKFDRPKSFLCAQSRGIFRGNISDMLIILNHLSDCECNCGDDALVMRCEPIESKIKPKSLLHTPTLYHSHCQHFPKECYFEGTGTHIISTQNLGCHMFSGPKFRIRHFTLVC